MINYCEIVDKAMGVSNFQHRTLRTCLDPGSSEWNETDIDEKLKIIKTVAAYKDLEMLLMYYKVTYREMNKPAVANNVESGLTILLDHSLQKF